MSGRDHLSESLAAAGFVRHTTEEDVQCVHCLYGFNVKKEYPKFNIYNGRHPMVIHARGNVDCPMVVSVLEKDSEPRGMTIAPDDCEETKKQREELWELLDNFKRNIVLVAIATIRTIHFSADNCFTQSNNRFVL